MILLTKVSFLDMLIFRRFIIQARQQLLLPFDMLKWQNSLVKNFKGIIYIVGLNFRAGNLLFSQKEAQKVLVNIRKQWILMRIFGNFLGFSFIPKDNGKQYWILQLHSKHCIISTIPINRLIFQYSRIVKYFRLLHLKWYVFEHVVTASQWRHKKSSSLQELLSGTVLITIKNLVFKEFTYLNTMGNLVRVNTLFITISNVWVYLTILKISLINEAVYECCWYPEFQYMKIPGK